MSTEQRWGQAPYLFSAAIAVLAVAALALAWIFGAGERLASERELRAQGELERSSADLWIGAGGVARSGVEIPSEVRRDLVGEEPVTVAARAERARSCAGALVRVVDRAGSPMAGIPVGLIISSAVYVSEFDVEIASAAFIADPVIAQAPTTGVPILSTIPVLSYAFTRPPSGWAPPPSSDSREQRAFAEVQWSDARGEVLFARERSWSDERWFIELAMPKLPPSVREVPAGARPSSEIEWTIDGLRRIEITNADDEDFAPGPWQVRAFAEVSGEDAGAAAWAACGEVHSFADGSVGELLAESSARVMIEAWQELPFWPRSRFVLEPTSDPAPQRLVLDAREHLAHVKLKLELEDRRRLESIRYTATLWDGERELAFDVETQEDGALELYLDARRSFGSGANLSFAMHSKFTSDETEAHLPLDGSITAGVTYDFGVVVLGTGPLLYAGEVVDELGAAVPYAKVHCAERGETIAADELGRFTRRGFAREPKLVLCAEAFGYFARRRRIDAGTSSVKLELHRAARLCGRVLAPRELEVAALLAREIEAAALLACFHASTPDGEELERTSAVTSDGRFELEALPVGAGRFELRWRDLVLFRDDWQLSAGLRDVGELDLAGAIALVRARVLRADGSAAANVEVEFEIFEGEKRIASVPLRTSDEGRVLCWLPSRATRFAATAEGVSIDGGSGGGAEHVLRLAR